MFRTTSRLGVRIGEKATERSTQGQVGPWSWARPLMEIFVDLTAMSFRVIVLGEFHKKQIHVLVYSSKANSWDIHFTPEIDYKLFKRLSQSTLHGNTISSISTDRHYLVSYSLENKRPHWKPFTVVAIWESKTQPDEWKLLSFSSIEWVQQICSSFALTDWEKSVWIIQIGSNRHEFHKEVSWTQTLDRVQVFAIKLQQKVDNLEVEMLENFFSDMDRYLSNLTNATEEEKLNATTMYLIGNAKLWWRTRMEDALAGRPCVDVGDQGHEQRRPTIEIHKGIAIMGPRNQAKGRNGDKTKGGIQTPRSGQAKSTSSINQPSGFEGKMMVKCFICIDSHYARDCPSHAELNTLGRSRDEGLTLSPMTRALQMIGVAVVEDRRGKGKMTEESLSTMKQGELVPRNEPGEMDRKIVVHYE
eukprot:Gb_13414 [translate_table: standard]